MHRLVAPMGGEDDEMYFRYENKIDVNNEFQMKAFIKEHLYPDFEAGSALYKDLMKRNLSYFLTTKKFDFKRQFICIYPPIAPPEPAINFFIWIWDEFFPNEDYIMKNPEECKDVENMEEPWKIYK